MSSTKGLLTSEREKIDNQTVQVIKIYSKIHYRDDYTIKKLQAIDPCGSHEYMTSYNKAEKLSEAGSG